MYEDSAEDMCADTFYENIWKGSMLGCDILGSAETVDAVTKESLQKHIAKFYVPERTVISICGNYDEKSVLAICKKYFADLKNTGFELNPVYAEYNPSFATVKKSVMQNQLILGFPGVSLKDKRREAALLISSILGGASSSKLFQHIREKLGLVYSIETACVSYLESGVFTVGMGLSEKSEETAIKETLNIISDFSSSVTEKDLSRAKEQSVTGFVMELENISARAARNARNLLLYGKITPEEEIIKNIRSVTLEDISKTANEIFDFSQISLCVTGKTKSKKTYKEIINSAK